MKTVQILTIKKAFSNGVTLDMRIPVDILNFEDEEAHALELLGMAQVIDNQPKTKQPKTRK